MSKFLRCLFYVGLCTMFVSMFLSACAAKQKDGLSDQSVTSEESEDMFDDHVQYVTDRIVFASDFNEKISVKEGSQVYRDETSFFEFPYEGEFDYSAVYRFAGTVNIRSKDDSMHGSFYIVEGSDGVRYIVSALDILNKTGSVYVGNKAE